MMLFAKFILWKFKSLMPVLSGLPQNTVLEKLQVICVDEENLFIHHCINTGHGGRRGKVQLNRLLQMEPQAKALPAGLPPVEIPGIIV